MTFLDGHSLAQTLYTSLYLLHLQLWTPELLSSHSSPLPDQPPVQLINLVLRAYIHLTLKSVELYLNEFHFGNHLKENEDLITDKCGVGMLEKVNVQEIFDLVDEAYEWLESYQGKFVILFRIKAEEVERANLQIQSGRRRD